MKDENTVICALLHDVVEDTNYTFKDLENLGFPNIVMEALKLLTHSENTPYMDYIKRLKDNKIARQVKIEDLKHNSDFSRLDLITENDLRRKQKYQIALEYLINQK